MKIHVLYRPKSDHATKVEDYLRDFGRRSSAKVELVDVDSREGIAEAGVYNIMAYPAILAMTDEGQLLNSWEGDQFPLMDELASYASL